MASRQDAWTRLPDDRIIHPYPFDIKLNPQPHPFAPISAAAIISSNRCRRRPYPRRRCRQPSNSSPAGSTPPFFLDRPADPTPEQLRFSILSSTFRSTGLSAPAAAAVRRFLPNFGRILCPTLRSVVPPAVALVPVLLGFRISEPLDFARLAPLFSSGCGFRLPIRDRSCWSLAFVGIKKKKSFQLGVSEPLASSLFD